MPLPAGLVGCGRNKFVIFDDETPPGNPPCRRHPSTRTCHLVGLSGFGWFGRTEREKVQRHAALVLGNVCQSDAHRAAAGQEGAVEGLFALCDAKDDVVRANALWALGNLAWDPYNQVRR